MRSSVVILSALLLSYAALIGPLTALMQKRTSLEKVGYVPEPVVLRMASADQKELSAAALIFRTMMYFGGEPETKSSVDYSGMEKFLIAATRLDPYNMDAYYFGQATLVWDLKHYAEANALLDYGMEYRTWDFYLPFFAGFNSAYFLKDFESAARYYRRAGELTGSDLFMKLAGRYLYETGATDQAIAYLTMMVQGAKNEALRKTLVTRLDAFKGVKIIEEARDRFQMTTGRLPQDLQELLQSRLLSALPRDPYGGAFYIDTGGAVRTTSNFNSTMVEKER